MVWYHVKLCTFHERADVVVSSEPATALPTEDNEQDPT